MPATRQKAERVQEECPRWIREQVQGLALRVSGMDER